MELALVFWLLLLSSATIMQVCKECTLRTKSVRIDGEVQVYDWANGSSPQLANKTMQTFGRTTTIGWKVVRRRFDLPHPSPSLTGFAS